MSRAIAAGVLLALMSGCSAEYADPERFRPMLEIFAAEGPQPEGAIVATGSSSIRMWHPRIAEDLAPLKIIPRGFGGSNMHDLNHWLDELVIQYKPRAVLLYEGDNDVAGGIPPEMILAEFDSIIAKLAVALPETRVYVLAIKPSGSRADMWPEMQATNALLQSRCQANDMLTYIDIATPMLDADGMPRESLFVEDRLHLNDAGYDVWRDAVRPVLISGEMK